LPPEAAVGVTLAFRSANDPKQPSATSNMGIE